MLAMAVMWQQVSPATYNQIVPDNVLTLPSVRHLRRLTSALDVNLELSVSAIAYLEARLSKLMPKDLYVDVIMNEVYCQQNVQYSHGKYFGIENSHITKTLLIVMIKSVAGKYRDVVCIHQSII